MTSGYTDCACRDCMEVAVSSDDTKPALCSLCEDAGCEGGECLCQPQEPPDYDAAYDFKKETP